MNEVTSNQSTTAREPARADFDPIANLPDSVAPYLTDTLESIENYAREKPWTFALWMMGVGFVIGWKIKPW